MRTRPKPASSKDVARLAGVSQSAVSRAFTPGAAISKATLAKVKRAATELSYKPNALARMLITSASKIIALVVGNMENPSDARIANDLSLRFQERGYHVLLFSVSSDAKVDAAIADMMRYRIDGVFLVAALLSNEMAEECESIGVPVVMFNRYARQQTVSTVRTDNSESGHRVGEFLVAGNHQRIGFIGGIGGNGTSQDRESGFRAALAKAGLEVVTRTDGDFTFESGRQAMERLWRTERLDAVFCASDLMALGAMDAARMTLGLDVPGDISIVGFDDLPPAAWPSYDLTTIRQPIAQLAQAAVDVLLSKIADIETLPRTILMSGSLIVRGSARMPDGWQRS